jgi:hypothetical protein
VETTAGNTGDAFALQRHAKGRRVLLLLVIKAETAAEKRFEAVNEFRGQLRDQAATFLPRAEYIAKNYDVERRLQAVEILASKHLGEARGSEALWGWIVGAGGFILAGLAIFLRQREFRSKS